MLHLQLRAALGGGVGVRACVFAGAFGRLLLLLRGCERARAARA